MTADALLLDDVVRIAATVGMELDVRPDLSSAAVLWASATMILLGDDAAVGMSGVAMSRRSDVILLGTDSDDADVWERAVWIGAQHVSFLPDAEDSLAERFADLVEGRPESAPLIGVVGGRGGAGATTLAVGLAITASRLGRRVVLVDADPLGGGIDLVVGGEGVSGLRWPDLAGTRGRVSSRALLEALPTTGNLTVLSWDRGGAPVLPAAAMEALLPAAQRGSDLVVADLPRRLDDAAASAVSRAATVLLVVPAEVRAAAAAVRVAATVSSYCEDVQVVVRGPAPGRLDAAVIAESVALPLAGFLRPEPGLAAALERGDAPAGRGRGPLAAFCETFLASLAVPGRQMAA
ncbi:MAG: septum site-determining protein Ssd [Frankiaceae bacterium]